MMAVPGPFVGLDMGTTNTRAWLVDGGRIAARALAPLGVRDSAVAGSSEPLRAALGRLIGELIAAEVAAETTPPARVVAAGMITSALGLLEVPHIPAPAGARELAAAVQRHRFKEIEGLDVYLVPGVRTGGERLMPAAIEGADVMRGEETLCVGLIESGLLEAGGMLLNLGSHWKAIRIDDAGRVAASRTSLSGELLHAAQTRTVLASSVPGDRPEDLDESWVRYGIAEAHRSGLARALFCVRLLEQRTDSDARARLSFLVGAFIGGELEGLARFNGANASIVIAGGGAIGPHFAAALDERGFPASVLDDAQVEAGMVGGMGRIVE